MTGHEFNVLMINAALFFSAGAAIGIIVNDLRNGKD